VIAVAISTLFFDLGNVLIHCMQERAVERFSEINGLSVEENRGIMGDKPDYQRGKITPGEYAQKYIKEKRLPISEEEFHKIFVDVFTLNKAMPALLKKLKGKFRLVMLSNTEKVTIAFLEKKMPELFSFFEQKIYSCDIGMIKPEKEIFLHALKIANVKPGETIFVDDLQENVDAAKNLGIQGIRFTTVQALEKELKGIGLEF